MQHELFSNGQITFAHGALGRMDVSDRSTQMIGCSILATEWDEQICYNPQNRIFFFEGELRTSSGGERTIFPIDGDLLLILPEELKTILIRVAETLIPETILFARTPNLLPK